MPNIVFIPMMEEAKLSELLTQSEAKVCNDPVSNHFDYDYGDAYWPSLIWHSNGKKGKMS